MQSHDFTQRFLANEHQLDLDAEAERAHLAALARGAPSIRRPLFARAMRVLRRSRTPEADSRATILGGSAAVD